MSAHERQVIGTLEHQLTQWKRLFAALAASSPTGELRITKAGQIMAHPETVFTITRHQDPDTGDWIITAKLGADEENAQPQID